MNKLRNTFITALFMFLSSNLVLAENYIMLSNEPIVKVETPNSSVICVKPITSLLNEKKTLIITPIADGTAEFKVKLKNRVLAYKATVKDGKIDFQGNRVIKIVPLDLPPEMLPTKEVNK